MCGVDGPREWVGVRNEIVHYIIANTVTVAYKYVRAGSNCD
jgi:hypothetical protein